MSHTPGPWVHGSYELNGKPAFVVDASGKHVAIVPLSHHDINPLPGEANAVLISAAPDLLKACEELLFALKRYGSMIDKLFENDEQFDAALRFMKNATLRAKGERFDEEDYWS